MLDVPNCGSDTIIFDPKEVLVILYLRTLGYYKKIKGILLQNLSKNYRFKKVDFLCKQFNKFINTLKTEKKRQKNKYPWLDPSDERKYMTDRKILEKYIDLERTCLTEKDKKEVMYMVYKYKEAFSLRSEIGTSPSIEVEIDVMG